MNNENRRRAGDQPNRIVGTTCAAAITIGIKLSKTIVAPQRAIAALFQQRKKTKCKYKKNCKKSSFVTAVSLVLFAVVKEVVTEVEGTTVEVDSAVVSATAVVVVAATVVTPVDGNDAIVVVVTTSSDVVDRAGHV